MPKPIKTRNVGKGVIDLRHHKSIVMMRPTELYLKEDGSTTDQPSLCIVMTNPYPHISPVAGQVSIEMLNDALADLGYKIVSTSINP